MKRALTIAAFTLSLASTALFADTVAVTTQIAFTSPNAITIQSIANYAFVGPTTITFALAGKTCNLTGSGLPNATAVGCNYALTVAPDGSISGTLTAASPGCTQTSQIASSCN